MNEQIKTTSEILALCDGGNIGVSVFRWTDSIYGNKRWSVGLKAQGDGVEVKGDCRGTSFDEALRAAWGKIEPFLAVPAGRKLIAQPVEAKALAVGDDDIPF